MGEIKLPNLAKNKVGPLSPTKPMGLEVPSTEPDSRIKHPMPLDLSTSKVESEIKEETEFRSLEERVEDHPKMKILKQFGGLETNIPINHAYWTMVW